MPCSDSSSHITIRLDHEERFISFDLTKITCGREIAAPTGYNVYCRNRALTEIVTFSYEPIVHELKCVDEEARFILYLEWDALRSAIAQYLGLEDEGLDKDRCRICAITHDEEGVSVSMTILPPKEMPKIAPCN